LLSMQSWVTYINPTACAWYLWSFCFLLRRCTKQHE
jgi:hypothetical protein